MISLKKNVRIPVFLLIFILIIASNACTNTAQNKQEIKQLVQDFGKQLKKISLQAPDSLIAPQIKKIYKPYVIKNTLQSWVTNPSAAPGRMASSPWPEKIKVNQVSKIKDKLYRVKAEVIYITSLEKVKGGAAMRKKVIIEVKKGNKGRWRISRYVVQ